MTAKTETVRARVRVSLNSKCAAERVLKKLGLTMSDAINLLLVQIKLKNGLPFEVKMPNEETRKALEETDKGQGLIPCKDLDDLYGQIEI